MKNNNNSLTSKVFVRISRTQARSLFRKFGDVFIKIDGDYKNLQPKTDEPYYTSGHAFHFTVSKRLEIEGKKRFEYYINKPTKTKLKEAIEQILPHYEKAVIEMPKEGHYEWLDQKFMDDGICYFAWKVLQIDIYTNLAIAVVLNNQGRIGDPLRAALNTYEKNLQQIQNRVDWMREYLSKN